MQNEPNVFDKFPFRQIPFFQFIVRRMIADVIDNHILCDIRN